MLFIINCLSNEEDLSIARSRDFKCWSHFFTTLTNRDCMSANNLQRIPAVGTTAGLRVPTAGIELILCTLNLPPSNWFVVRTKVLIKLLRTSVVTTNFITVILPDIIYSFSH